MSARFVLLLAIAALALPSTAAAKTKGAAVPTSPGIHRLVFEASSGPLRYTLSLPEAEGLRPLILSLHYAGHGADWYGATLLEQVVEPALRELGPIVVAPDCPGRSWSADVSEAAVAELLDFLATRYPLDAKRTLVTGYSLGGMGSWSMARRFPERFAAAIPMAGRPPQGLESWSTPTFVLHSRDDEIIDVLPTLQGVEKLQGAGAPVRLKLVSGLTHYETEGFMPLLRELVPWLKEVWAIPVNPAAGG